VAKLVSAWEGWACKACHTPLTTGWGEGHRQCPCDEIHNVYVASFEFAEETDKEVSCEK